MYFQPSLYSYFPKSKKTCSWNLRSFSLLFPHILPKTTSCCFNHGRFFHFSSKLPLTAWRVQRSLALWPRWLETRKMLHRNHPFSVSKNEFSWFLVTCLYQLLKCPGTMLREKLKSFHKFIRAQTTNPTVGCYCIRIDVPPRVPTQTNNFQEITSLVRTH